MKDLRTELQDRYDQVEARIKVLEQISNQTYVTSGQFKYNPSNAYSGVNIHTTTDIESLIHVNAFIQVKAKQYQESAEQIGLKEYPVFKWLGYSPELWLDDIKLRLFIIGYNAELQTLIKWRDNARQYLPETSTIKQLLGQLTLELPEAK